MADKGTRDPVEPQMTGDDPRFEEIPPDDKASKEEGQQRESPR